MSSILNLFSISDNLTKNVSVTNSASEYKKNTLTTPGLTQGDKFKKYQTKIRENLEKNINKSNVVEGFNSKIPNHNNENQNNISLTRETRNVLLKTNIEPQEKRISELQKEYKHTLEEYKQLLAKLTGATSGYLNRVSSNNPYLGKNIKIGNNIMYVTQQGIAKWNPNYSSEESISGLNGCPPSSQFINTNLEWSSKYETPGAKIPTDPVLITGTPMVQGQSCGNEGQNVYVNNMINPKLQIQPVYQGCFQDNLTTPAMNFIGGSPINSTSGTLNIDQCKQSAIDNGYRYFALQNVDKNTSLGYCAVSNNIKTASQYGNSTIPTGMVSLWESGTSGQPGNTAILQNTGALSVLNSSGAVIFFTPNSNAQPSNYLGCYGDSPNRAMPLYNNGSLEYDNAECQQIAQQNGFTYYGLQNSTSGTNAQCALSNDISQSMEYGIAGNCTKISDGSWSGGGWSNAIYNTSLPQSNYFLILQDDGNLCIYRGTGPNDNQGIIWAAGTNSKQQLVNPSYAASNGKYGQNWVSNGSTLAPGDFIGSTSGNMALIMSEDGNLVLYTFQNKTNCERIKTSFMIGGGVGANPVYDIGIVGSKPNMSKLAYIDQNAELHAYPSDNKQVTNSYTTFINTNSDGNDIPNATSGSSTVEQCQAICSDNPECYGFTFDTRNDSNICTLKTSETYPVSEKQLLNGVNLFIKNMQPSIVPIGVSNNTNNTDSITYKNYVNGGEIGNEYGLANITSVEKQQLEQLQIRLNILSNQISRQTNSFKNNDSMINNQGVKNMFGLGTYLNEIDNTNKKIIGFSNNIENILNDSDIVVLQENYNYLFWSILAAGTVLLSMNIMT